MPHERELIQSVNHAFDVITELIRKPRQIPNELSKALGFSRTAIYRLLWTLERRGAVVANENREYSLGPFFFNANIGRILESSLIDISLPALMRLSTDTMETVGIYLARTMEIICGEIVDSPYELRRITRPGHSLPLTRGAAGKCYLAWRLTELNNQNDFLASIGITHDQFGEWKVRLEKIRNEGFAVSWEERVPGGASIAAPVFNPEGQIVAVISISGPIGRITPEKIGSFSHKVYSTAREVEKWLRVIEIDNNKR